MATIDDFGGTPDPLNAPPLGGPSGWAAAVRDFIEGLPAQIAGKVAKSGDTMTGALILPGYPTSANEATTKRYVDELFWPASSSSVADWNDQIDNGTNNLLMGPGCPNHPAGNAYYYCFVFRYAENNLTQIAIPYLPSGAIETFKICLRGRYNGVWSAWGKVAIGVDS